MSPKWSERPCLECHALIPDVLMGDHLKAMHPDVRRWEQPVNQDAWVRKSDGFVIDGLNYSFIQNHHGVKGALDDADLDNLVRFAYGVLMYNKVTIGVE